MIFCNRTGILFVLSRMEYFKVRMKGRLYETILDGRRVSILQHRSEAGLNV